MARRDVPGSVRIRTDDGNEWRYDAIQTAVDYDDCNRSDAVAYACEDTTGSVAFVRTVLERDDLTVEERRDLANLASQKLRGVDDVTVTPDCRERDPVSKPSPMESSSRKTVSRISIPSNR
ncbi:hypothetical protein [Halorubellus sp. PRR65]|uniref:DUF7692 domain-containing protein n=1 Tax=Halorubellus sp. PRR65 TaxID=3098148 RepID=UPI002B25D94E|nr:hypothetical protein [Halorubellus sp. PRR65]